MVLCDLEPLRSPASPDGQVSLALGNCTLYWHGTLELPPYAAFRSKEGLAASIDLLHQSDRLGPPRAEQGERPGQLALLSCSPRCSALRLQPRRSRPELTGLPVCNAGSPLSRVFLENLRLNNTALAPLASNKTFLLPALFSASASSRFSLTDVHMIVQPDEYNQHLTFARQAGVPIEQVRVPSSVLLSNAFPLATAAQRHRHHMGGVP